MSVDDSADALGRVELTGGLNSSDSRMSVDDSAGGAGALGRVELTGGLNSSSLVLSATGHTRQNHTISASARTVARYSC